MIYVPNPILVIEGVIIASNGFNSTVFSKKWC